MKFQLVASKSSGARWRILGSPAEVKDLFRVIQSFAEQSMENLVVRFGEVPLVLAYQIFSPRWSFKQPELATAAQTLAAFWKLDGQELVGQLRAAFAIRDAMIAEDETLKTARSRHVWLRVLRQMTNSEADAVAREIIASFLVIQPQSAACERAFATVEELKPLSAFETCMQMLLCLETWKQTSMSVALLKLRKHLGQDCTAPLLEQELLIGQCAKPLREAAARVLRRFNATARRQVMCRKRAQRSDKGSHAQITSEPSALRSLRVAKRLDFWCGHQKHRCRCSELRMWSCQKSTQTCRRNGRKRRMIQIRNHAHDDSVATAVAVQRGASPN